MSVPPISWTPTSSAWNEDDWLESRLGPAPTKADRRRVKKARRRERKATEAVLWTTPSRPVPTFENVTWHGGLVKLIFCDFDGVLNDRSLGDGLLHADKVALLNRIVAETGARVVISSWWRCMGVERARERLEAEGFVGKIIGRTPWLGLTSEWDAWIRGDEIAAVLEFIGSDVESFVILDDHARMGDLLPHLVQTVSEVGLTDNHVAAAIALLTTARWRWKEMLTPR